MAGAWFLSVVILAGTTVNWVPFQSTQYSYKISQPSSYRYQPLDSTAHQPSDCFFPGLGSFVTSVCIYGDHDSHDIRTYLASIGGKHSRRTNQVSIMGKKHWLIAADFRAIGQTFTLEQMQFPYLGTVWHLTISYAPQFRKKQRPLMLHMLSTFRATAAGGAQARPH